jgi:hypothetical protein
MTGCAHRDDWLLDLLDGELTPERAAQVEEHLATCGDCRRAVDDYRAIIDSYRSGPAEEPPEEESARIVSRAAASMVRRRRGTRCALAAAATLLLAGGAVGGWLLRGFRPGEAPSAEEAEREAEEMRRALAEMMRELDRTTAEQAAATGFHREVLARQATDAGVEAAQAATAAPPGDADEITGGAMKVDGPRGGSGGLAAPRWQAKKKALAADPLSGDMDL